MVRVEEGADGGLVSAQAKLCWRIARPSQLANLRSLDSRPVITMVSDSDLYSSASKLLFRGLDEFLTREK